MLLRGSLADQPLARLRILTLAVQPCWSRAYHTLTEVSVPFRARFGIRNPPQSSPPFHPIWRSLVPPYEIRAKRSRGSPCYMDLDNAFVRASAGRGSTGHLLGEARDERLGKDDDVFR